MFAALAAKFLDNSNDCRRGAPRIKAERLAQAGFVVLRKPPLGGHGAGVGPAGKA